MPAGRRHKNVDFLNLLKELSGIETVSKFAKAIGQETPNASSYLSGQKTPQKKVLIKSIQYLFGWPIKTLVEIAPLPFDDWTKVPEKPGVYVLYDSGGNVIYVGKATNFRSEVRQTLERKIPVALRLGPTLKKTNPKMKNLVTRYSLYQIDLPRSRHNFETFFLRVFANQTHNSNIGSFRSVAP